MAVPDKTDKPSPDVHGSPWLWGPLRLRSHTARRGTGGDVDISILDLGCRNSASTTINNDVVCGSDGSDVISVFTRNDVVDAGIDNDVIWGKSGNDATIAGNGNNRIF